MDDKISTIRTSYSLGTLEEAGVGKDPIALFHSWMEDAIAAGLQEPNGMAVATASPGGEPAVRIVLLRAFDERGFVFYTNYESAKGRDLRTNPRAAATFWWQSLHRQVRIAGHVEKVSRAESEQYFRARPRGHQLSAWASPQSRPVARREDLSTRAEEVETLFPGDVPLPDFWGGYRIVPERIEFWQGRENRLHDRFEFELVHGEWHVTRLAP